MKIWVFLNGMQQGPYTLDQNSELPLTSSTPVWYEGLSQWLPASEAPLTASLFQSNETSQDEIPEHDRAQTSSIYHSSSPVAADAPPCPPTFIGWSVFILICCFPIGGILGIIFSVLSGNAYRAGDYTKAAKMSEYAEWTIILSIVIGLMFMPLMSLIYS